MNHPLHSIQKKIYKCWIQYSAATGGSCLEILKIEIGEGRRIGVTMLDERRCRTSWIWTLVRHHCALLARVLHDAPGSDRIQIPWVMRSQWETVKKKNRWELCKTVCKIKLSAMAVYKQRQTYYDKTKSYLQH